MWYKKHLNLIIIISLISNLTLVNYLQCSLTEHISTSTPKEKAKEIKITEKVKETGIFVPGLSELIAGYAAPNVITLHLPSNLIGKVKARYIVPNDVEKFFMKYPGKINPDLYTNVIFVGYNAFLYHDEILPLKYIVNIPLAKRLRFGLKLPLAYIIIENENNIYHLGKTILIDKDKTKALNYSISLIKDPISECQAKDEIIISSTYQTLAAPKKDICLKHISSKGKE